jgi:predicted DNA-binding ribbon-helix-helix protein
LFIQADEALWKSHTKSLRVDGVVTSIRLEDFFWQTLDEIAVRDQMTTTSLITKLYHEAMDAEHDLGNFTSFLRVCCARYLSLMADRTLERDEGVSLETIDHQAILQLEEKAINTRKHAYQITRTSNKVVN